MKLSKRYPVCIVLAVIMAVCLGLFAACSNNPSDSSSGTSSSEQGGSQSATSMPEELKGEYYCEDGEKEYTLKIEDGFSVTLDMGAGAKQATFTYSGTRAAWSYDGKAVTATLATDGNSLQVVYNGAGYTFYRKVNFTVTYEVDGSVFGTPAQVLNGKHAVKPQKPEKGGYYFVGWYKDAAHTEKFSFDDEVITGNITLYAYFVQYAATEFTVEFDLCYAEGEEIEAVTTKGHMLFDLPTPAKRTGYKFIGWWMSGFDSADKLTAEYEGQQLNSNMVLYAVWEEESASGGLYVSVNSEGFKWNSLGVNKSYTVKIKNAAGQDEGPYTTANLKYDYNFDPLPAGEYEITVTCDGYTGVAYYNNKALDAVSIFTVDKATNIIVWNSVANAQTYYVYFKCAGDNHTHEKYDTEGETSFDFSNCDIPADGYTIYVEAAGTGYATSRSKDYTFGNTLDKPANLAVGADGYTLTWSEVDYAQYYEITVEGNDPVYTLDTKYALENYSGSLQIAVKAMARTFIASPAEELTYVKEKLATPMNVVVSGNKAQWGDVQGATSYVVTIDGKVQTVNAAEIELTDEMFDSEKQLHTLTVQAKGDSEQSLSLASVTLNFTVDTVSPLTYENGKVYWAMVKDATGYVIQVNDEAKINVESDKYFAEVALTQSGANTIKVAYTSGADNTESVWATTTVEAVRVLADLNGGLGTTGLQEVYYLQKGSLLYLKDLTALVARDSYNFAGWYNKRNGRTTNAAKYNDNVPILLNSDLTVFGYWLGEERTVTLHLEEGEALVGGSLEMTYTVNIGDEYNLPAAELPSNPIKAFLGWYTEPSGQGIQCTDQTGASITEYKFYYNMTLYPAWGDLFTFLKIKNADSANPDAYSVSKGPAISYVTDVKIPATYQGPDDAAPLPVTTIEANGFKSCTSLVKFSMPDTIQNVEPTAFTSCSKLARIEIYQTGDKEIADAAYFAYDGILYHRDSTTKGSTVYLVPTARTGKVEIPYGVTTIGDAAFKSSKVTEIVIPASVTYIGKDAFYNSSSTAGVGLSKITFLPQPTGDDGVKPEEVPLTLAKGALSYCKVLTMLELPNRLAKVENGEDRWFFDIFVYVSSATTAATSGTIYTKLESITFAGDYVKGTAADGSTQVDVINYTAKDGCVYADNGSTLIYVPAGKTDKFSTGTGVKKIGDYAFFKDTDITSVEISGEVEQIGKGAFTGCTGITELTFLGDENNKDLTIGAEAFYGLTKITSLTLPRNVKQIDLNAFGGCSKLVELNLLVDERIIDSNGKSLIDSMAFANRKTSPTAVTTTYITTLYMGKYVPAIDLSELFGKKLAELTVDPDNANYGTYNDDEVLYGKDKDGTLINIAFIPMSKAGEYVIPDGIKEIPARLFNDRDLITKVTIPYTVGRIGEEAFYLCGGLTAVEFAPTPQDKEPVELVIENGVFKSCTKLQKIELPERTVELGDYVFSSATVLESISLPATLKTLKTTDNNGAETYESFFTSSTGKLTSITVAADSKYLRVKDGVLYTLREEKGEGDVVNYVEDSLVFCPVLNAGDNGTVNVPSTVVKVWDKAFNYNKAVKHIVFSQEKTDVEVDISKYAFYYMNNLESISLPYGLKAIKQYTFYYCSSLTELSIPQTVESLEGSNVFTGCSSLKRIVFLDDEEYETNKAVDLVIKDGSSSGSSEHISYYGAFCNITNLEEVIFPQRGYKAYVPTGTEEEGQTPEHGDKAEITIGKYAFYGAADYSEGSSTSMPEKLLKLTNIKLTDNVTTVGEYSFYKVRFDLQVPESVTSIGNYAFAYSGIKSYKIGEGMTQTPSDMFYYSKIEEVTLPSTLQTISTYTFYHCDNLTTVNFTPNKDGSYSLETIGTYAFAYTSQLKNITLPDSIKTLDSGAFMYGAITSINFPTSIETIGNAFQYCADLTTVTFDGDEANKSNLKSIAANTFKNAPVQELKFPSSNSDITLGAPLLGSNKSLTKVYLSESVKNIDGVFTGCSNLNSVELAENHPIFKADKELPILYNLAGTAIRFVYGQLGENFTLYNGESDADGNPTSTITEIGEGAFQGQTALTKIKIPKTVITIGENAFKGCSNLSEIEFEAGVLESIGAYAFSYCTSLETIELPASIVNLWTKSATTKYALFQGCAKLNKVTFAKGSQLKTIGAYTFTETPNLKVVEFPEGMTTLGQYAFKASGIEEITLPASLTTLSTYIFQNCRKLTTVHFPAEPKFTALANYMFDGCSSLKYSTVGEYSKDTELTAFEIPSKITGTGNYTFRNCTSLQKVVLPDTFKTIGTYVFQTSGLEEINLVDSITTIGNYAFNGTKLKEVTLPSGLTATGLGTYAFDNCQELTTVTFPASSKLTTINNYAFRNTPKLRYSRVGTSEDDDLSLADFYIPNYITTINTYAFSNSGLVNLVVPASVTTIGTYAFKGSLQLQSLDYKAGVVNNYLFQGCTALTTAKLNDNLTFNESGTTMLGLYMFDGCTSLQYSEYTDEDTNKPFALPKSAKAVPSYFLRNTHITTITIPANVDILGTYAFAENQYLTEVKDVPQVALRTYGANLFQNCVALTSFAIPKAWTQVPSNMFNGCTLLSSVTLGEAEGENALTAINGSAFKNCVNLKEIVIPAGIKTINSSAFEGCVLLETVDIKDPDTVTTLGSSAFKNCESLKAIDMPKDIGSSATTNNTYIFQNCKELESVEFNANTIMTVLPDYMFDGCTSLNNVVLPAALTKIGKYAFNGCTALEDITLPEGVTEISDNAFSNSGLKKVELSHEVTTLGAEVFRGCDKLTDLTINAENLSEIPANTFADDTSLVNVTLADTVTVIGERAFANTAIKTFKIPSALEGLDASIFVGCKDLTKFEFANNDYKFENSMLTNKQGEVIIVLNTNETEITYKKDLTYQPKAFMGNTNITKVTFENGITEIPEYALYGAKGLKEVVIPEGVEKIGAYAFADCESLTTITLPTSLKTLGTKTLNEAGEVESYNGGVFANTPLLTNIDLKNVEEVMPYTFDGSGITSVQIPDSVTVICDYAFFNANKLTSVKFNKTATLIGKNAFSQCVSLEGDIEITGKDLVIDDLAFASVTSATSSSNAYEPMDKITKITLGEGVKSVGQAAFRGTGATTLEVGASVESLGDYLFYKSEKLQTITFATENASLRTIGGYAFEYCTALNSEVHLPDGLETLGKYAFAYCEKLEVFTLPENMVTIGGYVIRDTAVKNFVIPVAETYEDYSFAYANFVSLELAEGITLPGKYMVSYNPSLVDVKLPSTLTSIGYYMFRECTAIKELYIPESVDNVDVYAFYGMTSDTTIYFVNIACPGSSWVSTWNNSCEAVIMFGAKPKTDVADSGSGEQLQA